MPITVAHSKIDFAEGVTKLEGEKSPLLSVRVGLNTRPGIDRVDLTFVDADSCESAESRKIISASVSGEKVKHRKATQKSRTKFIGTKHWGQKSFPRQASPEEIEVLKNAICEVGSDIFNGFDNKQSNIISSALTKIGLNIEQPSISSSHTVQGF